MTATSPKPGRQTARHMATVTSREFNQHTGRAKQMADKGPVFITDRGRPSYVLLTAEDYHRLAGHPMTLLEALEQKGGPEYDFEIELPTRKVEPLRFAFEDDR